MATKDVQLDGFLGAVPGPADGALAVLLLKDLDLLLGDVNVVLLQMLD